MKLFINLCMILLIISTGADARTVEITATVLNTSDITNGIITGIEPIQWTKEGNTIIGDF